MSKGKPVHRYISLDQVVDLRDAAHDRNIRYDSLGRRLRDEVLVVLGIDLGLRACELRDLKRSMFHLAESDITLPSRIQKDHPREDSSPVKAMLRIDPYDHFGTIRLLRSYFNSEWYQDRDSDYVFPTRQSDQMTTQSIRNTVKALAVEAEVAPRRTDGEPADPEEAHPHMLRHSLANYMLADEDTRLVDVRNRLRHQRIATTEDVYEHFQRR